MLRSTRSPYGQNTRVTRQARVSSMMNVLSLRVGGGVKRRQFGRSGRGPAPPGLESIGGDAVIVYISF
jgi:hypothetical protein